MNRENFINVSAIDDKLFVLRLGTSGHTLSSITEQGHICILELLYISV